jgi:hypothetical protein
MREDCLARIQGFLLALQTVNNSVTSRTYNEFTFLPVPEAGDLPSSLASYMKGRIQERKRQGEWAQQGVWEGIPKLEEAANWRVELAVSLNDLYFVIPLLARDGAGFQKCPRCCQIFMDLLDRFFDGEEPGAWRPKWIKPNGKPTYPWPIAYHEDWVFEHRKEWFHLALGYDD